MSEKLITPAPIDPIPQNAVFYQVAIPSPVLNAQGVAEFQTAGPFPDIGNASAFAQNHPGASLIVCVVLYKTPSRGLQN